MITDREQRSFLEIARPPLNMRLTYCIGTTFTLDFSALIALALATQGEQRSEETLDIADSYQKLYSFGARAIVFCQSCRIMKLPKEFFRPEKTPRQRLLSLLDAIITPISTNEVEGTFHPKVWLFRFDPVERSGDPVWKILIASRNLTEAQTWEICAELVGSRSGHSDSRNKDLKRFFSQLKDKSGIKAKQLIDKALRDLSSVEFVPPKPFNTAAFIAKRGKGASFPVLDNVRYKKIIAVSPFLAMKALKKLNNVTDAAMIAGIKDVQLLESLPKIKENTYLFKLEGMDFHAKLYLCLRKDGKGTDVYLGSANLTNAGMLSEGKNVEAMLKLSCGKDLLGDFENKFIYQEKKRDRSKSKLYPWLRRLNDSDLEDSLHVQDDEKKRLPLEMVRADLASGTFVLKRTGRVWKLRWNGSVGPWDPKVRVTLQVSDDDTVYDLRSFINVYARVQVRSKAPSAFILVRAEMVGVSPIEFGSVAEVIGGSKKRGEEVFQEIARATKFGEMLRSVLRESPGRLFVTKDPIPPVGEDGNESRQSLPGNGKPKRHKKIESYVEALLLSDLDSSHQREMIERTISVYAKRGNKEALMLQRFWRRLQTALHEVGIHANE
jgi:hypothetical protein